MSLVAVRHYAPSQAARLQSVRDCWNDSQRNQRRQAALEKWEELERLCGFKSQAKRSA
ncbi:hypothetical protein [Botrimarina mediterranea]|uniref:Uncharacterized protein n=1 Tax=Botrimarina mediterranea TaxID=2528022 RepID=A0A518K8V4_9BACT|nr:hypothetical protein [Botrimarina mediterranea]QDV74219.1 hypothetical protein Spa11_24190 [Botrimarina mediterranea]QDV78850.1 hypothetical protein K2D_24580 [Planctomycetes bacterium K2D]